MLAKRKIELQSRMIKRLQDENIRLHDQNKKLMCKLQEQSLLVEAAENYRNEHQKSLSALNNAKEKYNKAIKDVITEKKRLKKKYKADINNITY